MVLCEVFLSFFSQVGFLSKTQICALQQNTRLVPSRYKDVLIRPEGLKGDFRTEGMNCMSSELQWYSERMWAESTTEALPTDEATGTLHHLVSEQLQHFCSSQGLVWEEGTEKKVFTYSNVSDCQDIMMRVYIIMRLIPIPAVTSHVQWCMY